MLNKSAKFCVHSSSKIMTFFSPRIKGPACIVAGRHLECFFKAFVMIFGAIEAEILNFQNQKFFTPLSYLGVRGETFVL